MPPIPASLNPLQRIRDLLQLGKLDLALREVQRALQTEPENGDLHYYLAWILWQKKRRLEALPAAQKALSLAPEDADHHSLLGLILQEARVDRPRAEEHHRRSIALAPQVGVFHVRYAHYLRAEGRGEAWEELRQALECDPQLVGAHLLRGQMYRDQRRFDEAQASAREALAIEPLNPAGHELLGDLAFDQYQSQPAFAHFREALRLDPADPQIKRKLIHTLEARLPVIGKLWNFTHMLHTHERQIIFYYLVIHPILCCLLNPGMLPLFLLVACVDGLIGLGFVILNFVVEPMITKAVLEGKIQP